MPVHVVKSGEWLSKIAEEYGFSDWKAIYNYSENADFRRLRPNPNVIEPGDRIVIPPPRSANRSLNTGSSHKFRIRSQKTILRLTLCQADGSPLADAEYTLRFNEFVMTGRTASDGRLEETLPRGASRGKLELPEFGREFVVKVGELDPLDTNRNETIAAAQARLRNLGYECGPIDGIAGRRTFAAVRSFRADMLQRRNPSGILDRETRSKLISEHGC